MANAPYFKNHSGVDEESQGVIIVNPDGSFADFSGGVGSGGDASAANQVTGNASLATIAGLNKAVDAAAGATDSGVLALSVRDDVLSTLTPVDGDYTQIRTNARGAMWMAIEDGAGGQITAFAGAYTEDAAAPANPIGNPTMLVRKDAPASEVTTDNDWVAWRGTSKGEAYTHDSDGLTRLNLLGTEVTLGQLLTELSSQAVDAPLDDTAFVAGSSVFQMGFIADETSPDSVDEGDVGIGRMTLDRKPYAAAGGDVAHDGVDANKPVKIGGKAIAALSGLTLVASLDRTDASFDLDGALIVRNGGAIGDRVSGNASNTDGSSTACIAAQGANIKTNLTDVTLTNMHATSTIYVEIKDGSTVKWTFPVPALGGVTHRFETPLSGTANTAWNFDPSAATTTIYCSMSGRLSKV